MTSGRPPWQILGDGQPGPEDEQLQPEPEKVAAAKAGQERTESAEAAAGAGEAPPATVPAATVPAATVPAATVPAATVTAPTVTAPTVTAPTVTAAATATARPPWDENPENVSWPGLPGSGPPRHASPVLSLSARLTALTQLIQIAAARTGSGGFPEGLIEDAEALVERAGERLRLSAGHTVAALAGGTGSGKSSLFNYLAGADFSTVGVTRPVTRDPHACVWGASGSGPLLDWLGVPRRFRYAQGSELDGGEASLNGLVLVDLPDHDSVVAGASHQVDRLIGMADLMVWVLDPQKYADAAVHRRYLVPLAGHAEVIAVVLNQADLLSADEVKDCTGDLRRLLDSEGLHNAAVLVTSAVTGAGMERLRKMLVQAVSDRRASSARISADLDGIAAELAPYAEQQADGRGRETAANGAGTGAVQGGAEQVPVAATEQLVDAFSGAAGVSAVADALQTARELRAVDYVGWPVAWFVERLTGRDPVRRMRLGRLWAELKSMAAGPSGAQQADIDSALTRLADDVGGPLPKPWSQTVRAAVRSRAEEIPAAIGTAMGESIPEENKIMLWWRLVGALQGLLLGCEIVSLLWIVALTIFGVFRAAGNVPQLFGDASLLPWIVILFAAFLILGWLTAAGCTNLVRAAAGRERGLLLETIRAKIETVAREMVLAPAELELAEFQRFRGELRVAAGA
jgi:GTP-binding protein EngB required for normal cell division